MSGTNELAQATLGAGCFWCVEAVFQELAGVKEVVPGYTGGHVPSPTYEQVCSGTTGHAEVARITYDPARISFADLLEVFWRTHDPTTLNRQGADVGTQYRSVIFPHTGEQRRVAEEMKAALDASGAFPAPIVTSLEPLGAFHPAENYHHDYYARNGSQGYCAYVIAPKLEKFRKAFADRLKPSGDEAAG
ncbi:MAG: peptide-methionine (S)-S-oxide reductase MsrA [Flavobacteriales bacterium]